MKQFLLSILLALCSNPFGSAAEPPRRGALGITVGPAPDSARTVVVQRVAPGSAAEAAGMQPGDVLREMDGVMITEPSQVSAPRRYQGQIVRIAATRRGEPLSIKVTVRPKPFETSPNAEVLYRWVTVRGSQRRVIITKPAAPGKHPALLLMGGIGCYSLDGLDRTDGYGRVLDFFERRNFVTMRVEKTGEGDSEGPACSSPEATPELEAEGYLAGLRALKSYYFVDPASVLVFAHSLGPVIGSLVVGREPLRGFIAVETVGTSWFEYDLERHRVQAILSDKPADLIDREAREFDRCSYRFLVLKEKREMLRSTPVCAAMLDAYPAVPYTYIQAIADINLAEGWKGADIPVLVIYGTSSPVTTAWQNRYLVELLNNLHPGRATYAEVAGMGHDLARYESQREYHLRSGSGTPHPFHTGLFDVISAWSALPGNEPK